MKDNAGSTILMVLAVLGAVAPIIFGFVVYKLTREFVTRDTFEEYKETAELQRRELLERVREIDKNVVRILELRLAESAAMAALRKRHNE